MIKNKCFKSSIAALSIISLSVMSTFVAMATSQNDSDSSVLMKNVVESDTNILSIDGSVDLEEKITLCDMKGTLYAYFIPVVDNAQNKISGYSVVSAVGTPKTLVTAIGDNAASLSVAIMSAFESTGEMIYEFPSAFITKNGDNYYKICMDGSLNEILNPSDYESSTVEFLKSEIPQTNSTKATTVYGQLDDWDTGAFLPIKDDGSGTKMVTSNWAGKEIYDFPTWVNGGSLYKGVIYFE
nr:hypothetical protein [Lacrimispora amygdalina]